MIKAITKIGKEFRVEFQPDIRVLTATSMLQIRSVTITKKNDITLYNAIETAWKGGYTNEVSIVIGTIRVFLRNRGYSTAEIATALRQINYSNRNNAIVSKSEKKEYTPKTPIGEFILWAKSQS